MKNQLKGIALILCGILLALVGVSSQIFAPGSANMVWSLIGIVLGVAGLILTFMKNDK